jgi:heme-degrading monooxygenase HmoA
MSAARFAATPEPPYWVVVFSSQRRDDHDPTYATTAELMEQLAERVPGFLGIESVRAADGFGITASYWESEAAIAAWRGDLDHQAAQRTGKTRWYDCYRIRVARVERAYGSVA